MHLPMSRIGLLVVAQRGLVEEVTLLGLARGIADHARSSAHEGQRAVSAHLEMLEDHHSHEVSDME